MSDPHLADRAIGANPDFGQLRRDLEEFARYRQRLTGDEKGEAQVFCDRLFRALGLGGVKEAGATLEERIKRNDQKGTAFADLMWKPRVLIEMKKAGTDLSRHYRQAFDYWVAAVPDRPRYVILCNFDEFWIYDFDNQMDAPVDRVTIADLPHRLDALAFMLPEPTRPVFGNDLVAVTREAAGQVANLFTELHARGVDRVEAQRFALQAVMAMFAEDIGLLPAKHFTRALEDSNSGADAYDLLFGLFREMNTLGETLGGRYQGTPYFNGGLFADIAPFELTGAELELLREASVTDWSAVRPEIFGTLFEGSMEAGERHARGAHFTSQADIARVVIPTIVTPFRKRLAAAGSIPELEAILDEMQGFRVLDPACGSGNFLYVAYREMRRLEHDALSMIAERRLSTNLAAQGRLAYITPDHFYGIELNPFGVEVAKVTMMLAKKLAADELGAYQPVLPLDNLDATIVAGDALFTSWPKAHVVIGNPPYLGRRKMSEELGPDYTQRLARTHPDVGGVSDYVSYWFPLTHDHLPVGGRAGLVATNSVRQNESREVSLDYIVDNGGIIFDAVSSQPWSGDANVHVSIINWSKEVDIEPKVLWLNEGQLRLETDFIPSSLAPTVDVRNARKLRVNTHPSMCFQGQTPGITDAFVIAASTRDQLLKKDASAAQFIHPFLGGTEMLGKTEVDRWVIDLPQGDAVSVESEAPTLIAYLRAEALPKRQAQAADEARTNALAAAADSQFKPVRRYEDFLSCWWQLTWRRSAMLDRLRANDRYLGTSRTATKNRRPVFEFVDPAIHPSDAMTVFALSDDYSFGIMSSSVHHAWLLARCSTFKADPRYTSTTVWDSFPWPQDPNNADVAEIAAIAEEILTERAHHLGAGVSLRRQYDAVEGPGQSRLATLHRQLDRRVISAYGFSNQDDLVTQILALNQAVHLDPAIARGPGGRDLPGSNRTSFRLMPPL